MCIAPDDVVVKDRLKNMFLFGRIQLEPLQQLLTPLNLDTSFPLDLSLPLMFVGTTRLPIRTAHL